MPLHVYGTALGPVAIGLALLSSIGGGVIGYDTGQISGILIMKDFLHRFGTCTNPSDPSTCSFNTYIEGLIVSALSIGTIFGALLGASFADQLGRTRAMSAECLVFVIGVLVQVTAFEAWYQIMIGRLVTGLGVGALSAVVPLYQAETLPKELRGALIGTFQLAITSCMLLAASVNLGTSTIDSSASWRIPISIGIVLGVILGVGILFMPESPRWLIKHGRDDQALQSLARIHGVGPSGKDHDLMSFEYNEILESVNLQRRLRVPGWLDCFKSDQKTLYRTLLGMALQMCQQLTGANYFFFYGATIFQGVGISNAFATQVILNGTNLVSTFSGLYVMQNYGRRRPLIVGALWQAAWLFVFSSVGVAHDPRTDSSTAKVMIISACFFIFGNASTWGPGVWILMGEQFSLRTRARQSSIASASNWFCNFLIAFWTAPVTGDIGYAYGYVFAVFNLIGAVLVTLFLYEPSGISLEAVDAMYNDKSVKPWTSGSWIPEGYSTRRQMRADLSGKQGIVTFIVGESDDIHAVETAGVETAISGKE